MATNVLSQPNMRDPFNRERVLFHESGHIVRFILDGDRAHWDNDLFRFALGRCHQGTEIFAEGYAFNEGWASYWRDARWSRVVDRTSNPTPTLPPPAPALCTAANCRLLGINFGAFAPADALEPDVHGALTTDYCEAVVGREGVPLTPLHMDWVERLVTGRLLFLANNCFPGLTFDQADSAMVSVLERNPGGIHRLWEFEQALTRRLVELGMPVCGAIRTTPPDDCPPGFTDDGESCSQTSGASWHIIHEP